jgi:uncharacterized protein YebE (UPF0316 family)
VTLQLLAICVLIVIARIADVSLGTIRTICVVQGRAALAWVLAFMEILIWIFVVSRVITNLDTPAYAIAYALGYATGNFVGITLEKRLAFGRQVVRIFTRAAGTVPRLRELGYRVTEFTGRGRDGAVELLFIETTRREAPRLLECAAEADPQCYYLVDDIRLAANPAALRQRSTGWWGVFKKK